MKTTPHIQVIQQIPNNINRHTYIHTQKTNHIKDYRTEIAKHQ